MSDKMEAQYEGHFIDALDLPEGVLVPVVIESIAEPGSEKDSSGKVIKQAILGFKGKTKRFIMNRTNYRNLKAMFGRDDREWIGKTIHIQRRYLDAAHGFGVQNTLCLRIVPPVGTPILKSAANFMGQPHPYGDVPKQQPKSQPPKKPAPEQKRPEPVEETGVDLDSWAALIEPLKTLQHVQEFRDQLLPNCPAELRLAVEALLVKKSDEIVE